MTWLFNCRKGTRGKEIAEGGLQIAVDSLIRHVFVGVMAVFFVGSAVSGAENDWSEIRGGLERVANEHRAKLVLTPHAYNELERAGVHGMDSLLLSGEVVHGWRVLYSGGEDVEKVIDGYEENLRIWNLVFDRATMQKPSSILKANTLGASLSVFNQTMSHVCGVKLVLSVSAEKTLLSIIDAGGGRADDLCQDYMLFLSASGIRVKRALNHIIGVDE